MSNTQVLRNPLGVILATITTDNHGVQTIRSPLGVIWGTYNPKTNQTRNYLGQLIGTGNLLTSLIK